jgi:predicted transcriptional regulator
MSLETDIAALLEAETDDFGTLLAACGLDAKTDLVGADLAGLDLSRMNFREAFLQEADLSGAVLDFADLRSCDLSSSNLSGASLIEINAVGAVFRSADLRRAYSIQGDLSDAIFSDSIIDECTFARVNLRGALMDANSASNAVFHQCDGLDEKNARTLKNVGAYLTGVAYLIGEWGTTGETPLVAREEAPLVVTTRERGRGTQAGLLGLTTEIVASHLSTNVVPVGDVPELIRQVYGSLSDLSPSPGAGQPEKPQPAVAIKKSVTPEYIICLEDGKKLKMLKRYLKTRYDMTPEEYRERWGCPTTIRWLRRVTRSNGRRSLRRSALGPSPEHAPVEAPRDSA